MTVLPPPLPAIASTRIGGITASAPLAIPIPTGATARPDRL